MQVSHTYFSLASVLGMPNHEANGTDRKRLVDVAVYHVFVFVELDVGHNGLQGKSTLHFRPCLLVAYVSVGSESVPVPDHGSHVHKVVGFRQVNTLTTFVSDNTKGKNQTVLNINFKQVNSNCPDSTQVCNKP